MKPLSIYFLALVVLLGSCKKDDDGPAFTSAAGEWTYTSPDGKVTINFTITESTATTFLHNTESNMVVDGISGKSIVDIEPPIGSAFSYIRVNANDATLNYSYPVTLRNGMISDDFTSITMATGTYTWPYNKTNSLTDVVIVRR